MLAVDRGCCRDYGVRHNPAGAARGRTGSRAHRVAWEIANGPIPDGLVIDHLCGIPRCVNPSHLELVTFRENVLRGNSISAQYARSTECANGHLRKPEERGNRCAECHRAWWRERNRKKKTRPE